MNQTILSVLGTSTPLSEQVAKELGLVRAAIACRVFFYQQLKDGVCKATNKSFQDSLGLSAGAVSSNLKWLREKGWIINTKPLAKGNHPNYYKVTQKFYDLLERSSNERQRSPNESNVHLMNGKEESKEVTEEDSKREGQQPLAPPANSSPSLDSPQPSPPDKADLESVAYLLETARIRNVPDSDILALFSEMSAAPGQDRQQWFEIAIDRLNGNRSWQIIKQTITDIESAGGLDKYIAAHPLANKDHPAIQVYREVARLYPDKANFKDVAEAVGIADGDLDRWEVVVKAYVGQGWNKRNVNGMLDFFKRGEIPGGKDGQASTNGSKRGASSATQGRGRRSGSGPDNRPGSGNSQSGRHDNNGLLAGSKGRQADWERIRKAFGET